MNTLVLLSGVAGSGKSSFAKEYFKDAKVISSDEIRYSLTSSYHILLKDMNIVYDKMIEETNDLFESNKDITIVLDSTFLDDSRREYFLSRIKGQDKTILIMLRVPLEEIIRRNKNRKEDKAVPEQVIREMYSSFSYPKQENISHYDEIKEYNW
ncbi:MAG: ATP-binding protein [Mollicutes bacterium]|nr:ATP-binding protein [Mollicutes bacterium]